MIASNQGPPMVIVGYGSGASAALATAQAFEGKNIPVPPTLILEPPSRASLQNYRISQNAPVVGFNTQSALGAFWGSSQNQWNQLYQQTGFQVNNIRTGWFPSFGGASSYQSAFTNAAQHPQDPNAAESSGWFSGISNWFSRQWNSLFGSSNSQQNPSTTPQGPGYKPYDIERQELNSRGKPMAEPSLGNFRGNNVANDMNAAMNGYYASGGTSQAYSAAGTTVQTANLQMDNDAAAEKLNQQELARIQGGSSGGGPRSGPPTQMS
ncbi:MAG TPA: hypothetical protein VHB73_04425, partial [Alphaproteobacteria bacterium]|nr:hypothetical protein [Alphaproteobacteria bacterium]